MPITRVSSFAESYGISAREIDRGEKPLHLLSGRSHAEATESRNAEIRKHLALETSHSLADIGCGDGSLLISLANSLKKGVGIVPTESELQLLRSRYSMPNIEFERGRIDELPLQSAEFDRIVCNGVLLLLDTASVVQRALDEFWRIAKPNARLFLGEVSERDEYVSETKLARSPWEWLVWQWRNNGKRAFGESLWKYVRARTMRKNMIVVSQSHFYGSPPEIIAMANQSQWHLDTYFRSRLFSVENGIVESKSRYDYIFSK